MNTSPLARSILRFGTALGVLCCLAAALGALRIHAAAPRWLVLGLAAVGTVLLLARPLAPQALVWALGPAWRGLEWLGARLGDAILAAVYVVLVWPYARLLMLLGVLAPPESETWPPPPDGRWHAVETAGQQGQRGRLSRPGAGLARIAVVLGSAIALLQWLGARPAWFLAPVVLLLAALAMLTLLGHATGLGPLIYTLF